MGLTANVAIASTATAVGLGNTATLSGGTLPSSTPQQAELAQYTPPPTDVLELTANSGQKVTVLANSSDFLAKAESGSAQDFADLKAAYESKNATAATQGLILQATALIALTSPDAVTRAAAKTFNFKEYEKLSDTPDANNDLCQQAGDACQSITYGRPDPLKKALEPQPASSTTQTTTGQAQGFAVTPQMATDAYIQNYALHSVIKDFNLLASGAHSNYSDGMETAIGAVNYDYKVQYPNLLGDEQKALHELNVWAIDGRSLSMVAGDARKFASGINSSDSVEQADSITQYAKLIEDTTRLSKQIETAKTAINAADPSVLGPDGKSGTLGGLIDARYELITKTLENTPQ